MEREIAEFLENKPPFSQGPTYQQFVTWLDTLGTKYDKAVNSLELAMAVINDYQEAVDYLQDNYEISEEDERMLSVLRTGRRSIEDRLRKFQNGEG